MAANQIRVIDHYEANGHGLPHYAAVLAAKVGASLRGGYAYVTHQPCARCARTLIQAGIQVVYTGAGQTNMPAEEFEVAKQMFLEAGVYVIPMASESEET